MLYNKRLHDEIKKCIVLCANCHRKLHYSLKNKNYVHSEKTPPEIPENDYQI